ncbi:MAG: prepilin-type N-terminal cleavage/methylation domain-containing protein [Verrucomicrobiota bacterium]|jgi:prepilin-type N-terminal cleavage/methylation domain-containing protein|nr:prepilin-type N-terminal cleavage/methylation domain-containing protein [Verrucomicrobiota bacterium]
MKKYGFTLIELMVVIVILGILLAMAVPAAGLILKKAKIAQARSDASVVVGSMMKYRLEYNRWPPAKAISAQNGYETDKDWMEIMNPPPDAARQKDNFHMITFLTPGPGTLDDVGNYVDPWGQVFLYQVDDDGDGMIDHPAGGSELRAQVIAWTTAPEDKNKPPHEKTYIGSWE